MDEVGGGEGRRDVLGKEGGNEGEIGEGDKEDMNVKGQVEGV